MAQYANEQLLAKDNIWVQSQGKTLIQMAEGNIPEKERFINIINSINTSIVENRLVQFEETRINDDGSICYQMCWITKFDVEACMINKKELFTWDSESFIWKELYNTVKSYIVDKQVTIDFEDIMQDIPVEDFKYVYVW